jgi:hypothetical protein
MDLWNRLRLFFGLRPRIKRLSYPPKFIESAVQFGDHVRILSDAATNERGLTGKTGTIWGQTVPSASNVEVVGAPKNDYAVSVFVDELEEQYWLPDHLVEVIDHGAGTVFTLEGVDKKWTRNSQGGWDESPK